jgi:hypothetical protein
VLITWVLKHVSTYPVDFPYTYINSFASTLVKITHTRIHAKRQGERERERGGRERREGEGGRSNK